MVPNTLFLLNPLSNDGRALSSYQAARKKYPQLPEQPVDLTVIDDLADMIRETRPQVVVIAGGDGTINYVCRTVYALKQKPLLAILPFGFGNALANCFGVETLHKAIEVLQKKPRQVTVDLMQTNIPENEIGVFNISAGFDARVVHHRKTHRYIGVRSYLISAITSLVTHSEKEMSFTIDHAVTIDARASSLVIAQSPIIGQNLLIAPDAKLNDGFLDCTLFASKYAYVTNLRLRGFKHPLYTNIGKAHFKAKHIKVYGEPFLQIDGDPVLQKDGITVEVLPKQVTFLTNSEDHILQRYQPFLL